MRHALLVVTPWKRRWELGDGAGLADDFHFIRGLTARGIDVHYVSPRDADPPDVVMAGYHVHPFANFFDATAGWPVWLRRLVWPVLFTALASWRAWRVGRAVRPSWVLAQTHVAGAAAFVVARALRVPSVVKLFGVMGFARKDEPRLRDLRRHFEMIVALKFPHAAWIVLDDGTRGDEALRRHGVPADRIHLLPNGVNLDWQDRAADSRWLRDRLGLADDVVVVLYLSRLVDWKRPDAFVRAAARVAKARPERAVFVVAGEGPERARCERLARELGVDVRFAGAIPHDHIPDALAAAAVFVATSEHSNRSIAVCEALVCGVPVVAFDTGETRAVVRDGETGRLVRDGDVEKLADAIVSLLQDEAQRQRLADGARSLARRQFTAWHGRVEMEYQVLERLS